MAINRVRTSISLKFEVKAYVDFLERERGETLSGHINGYYSRRMAEDQEFQAVQKRKKKR